MKKIKLFFTSQINKLVIKWRVKSKIREANFLKLTTGKTHFVVSLDTGRYMVINSSYLKPYNKATGRKLTYQDLCRMAVYKTK